MSVCVFMVKTTSKSFEVVTVSHRNEYSPHIFVNILLDLFV